MSLDYHPEFKAAIAPFAQMLKDGTPSDATDIAAKRKEGDEFFSMLSGQDESSNHHGALHVESTVVYATADDGHKIAIHHFKLSDHGSSQVSEPEFKTAETGADGDETTVGSTGAVEASSGGNAKDSDTLPSHDGDSNNKSHADHNDNNSSKSNLRPAIVHMHGGGFVMGRVEQFRPALNTYVQKSGVQLLSIEYRLAPEHPYPTPTNDCYAALQYVHDHAAELGVDNTRLAVMGESAGGCLAAAVALMARDRGLSPPLAKQILIYPMLDSATALQDTAERKATTTPGATDELRPLLMFNEEENVAMWSAYLGGSATAKVDFANADAYASPARAKSLKGLPPAYLDIGTLDLFRNEVVSYVSRLLNDDVPVEFHVYEGVPHGFEMLAPRIKVVAQAETLRANAMMGIETMTIR